MTTATGRLDSGLVSVRKADGTGAFAKWAVVQVVGPASYAAGGFQVDCSAFFSSIISAVFSRDFTTATGVIDFSRPALHGEAGSDLFSAAKFRCVLYRAPTHTHTYDKYNLDTSLTGSGTTYTSTASGGATATSFAELGNGNNVSAITYEFLVLGVPK